MVCVWQAQGFRHVAKYVAGTWQAQEFVSKNVGRRGGFEESLKTMRCTWQAQ